MRINVHGGHNPAGNIACGAVGILDESREDRLIKDKVIARLRQQGHTVYDCTVEDGVSQSDVLQKIVAKCNAHTVDLDVSIHLNSGGGTGSEVWIYGAGGEAERYAKRIAPLLAQAQGIRNRGVKTSKALYVLRKTKAPAVLVEVCFVDSKTDAAAYQAHREDVAAAIVEGITGQAVSTEPPETTEQRATYDNPEQRVDFLQGGVAVLAPQTLWLRPSARWDSQRTRHITKGDKLRWYGGYTVSAKGETWLLVTCESGQKGYIPAPEKE